MRLIPQSTYVKGMWRNGRGISWDIASDAPFSQAGAFGWRLAIAEIAASGPFSLYGPVDRIFTLLDGDGVDLEFEGGKHLAVHDALVPHYFPCDVPTHCTLKQKVSRALNLFTARGAWTARAEFISVDGTCTLPTGTTLLYAVKGDATVNGITLHEGDAAELAPDEHCFAAGSSATLYAATLIPEKA